MKERIHNTDEAIMEEVKRLDLIAREAWAAWERSQEPYETIQIIQTNGEKKVVKTVRKGLGRYSVSENGIRRD